MSKPGNIFFLQKIRNLIFRKFIFKTAAATVYLHRCLQLKFYRYLLFVRSAFSLFVNFTFCHHHQSKLMKYNSGLKHTKEISYLF